MIIFTLFASLLSLPVFCLGRPLTADLVNNTTGRMGGQPEVDEFTWSAVRAASDGSTSDIISDSEDLI